MATARVSGSHAQNEFGDSASARTLAYAGNLTSGSFLEVTVSQYNIGVTLTVSDGTNGSYTQAGAYSISTDTTNRVSKWIFKNNSSTSTPTVTVTPSASSYISISLDEYTGLGANPTVHSSATGAFTLANTVTTSSVTASAGDLTLAGLNIEVGGVATATSPFLLSGDISGGTNEGIGTSYHLSAAGNESAAFGMDGVSGGTYIIISITPDGGGGGGGKPYYAYAQQ